jgi:hypothetical protein
MPKNEALFAGMVVVLPIGSLFLRAYMGKRQIELNNCRAGVRGLQYFVLAVAIVFLFLMDGVMITMATLPRGVAGFQEHEWVTLGSLMAVYVMLMLIAMYPGQSAVCTESLDGAAE